MSWHIEHSKRDKLLLVTATGPVSTEDVQAQATQGIEIIKREQLQAVLADYSSAVLEMPIMEIYKMPDMFETLGLPKQTRMAILLPSDPVNMHKYTFFDDTATNRGYQVKLFWEESHAIDWAKGIVTKRGPKPHPKS